MGLLSTVVFVGLFHAALSACRNGWTQYDNSCYHLSRDTESWTEAQKMCELHSASLLRIESAAENTNVKAYIKQHGNRNSFWIGATDWDVEGIWVWEPLGDKVLFHDWYTHQPDNYANRQHCAIMRHVHNYHWSDSDCHSTYHYICETGASEVTTTSSAPNTSDLPFVTTTTAAPPTTTVPQ